MSEKTCILLSLEVFVVWFSFVYGTPPVRPKVFEQIGGWLLSIGTNRHDPR